MKRTYRLLGAAAALMMVAVQAAPAKAQFAGGGEDMMTQMAPMLNMMKAKMGKKRFGMLMQSMGPMMTKMMDGSGGFGGFGFGGTSFGGFNNFGSFGGGSTYTAPSMAGGDYATTTTSSYAGGGLPFIGGVSGFAGGDMVGMITPLMGLATTGAHHRRHVHPKS